MKTKFINPMDSRLMLTSKLWFICILGGTRTQNIGFALANNLSRAPANAGFMGKDGVKSLGTIN